MADMVSRSAACLLRALLVYTILALQTILSQPAAEPDILGPFSPDVLGDSQPNTRELPFRLSGDHKITKNAGQDQKNLPAILSRDFGHTES